MPRILLVAVVAVVACRGGSGSAHDGAAAGGSVVARGSVSSVAPTEAAIAAPAGKVIEVTGEVMVRGKPLVLGDAVTADDVIETGAHGRVVVLLPIDDSHWELGPNQRAKVSEASAWTVLTDAGTAAQDAGASPDAVAAPPTPQKPAAPKPPPASADASASSAAGGGITGATVGQAKINSDAAADLIGRQESALRSCLSAGARVQIHVRVNDAGSVSTSIDGAASGAVSTCLKGVIAKVKLAPAKASVNMTIENSSQ
jgi:hypothetical protein